MRKKEKMVLVDLRHINGNISNCFKVIKLVNTIRFKIDEYLSASKVEEEIKYNPDITVEIIKKS